MAGKGVIEILNAQKGHDEFQIPEDPAKAKEEIDGMLRKGFTLMLNVDGQEKKINRYDQATNEYIVKETQDIRYPAATAKVTAIAPVAGG